MISIKRKIISFLITGAALIVLFLVAVNTGSLKASPEQILRGLFVAYDETVATIYSLRFPRILIATTPVTKRYAILITAYRT